MPVLPREGAWLGGAGSAGSDAEAREWSPVAGRGGASRTPPHLWSASCMPGVYGAHETKSRYIETRNPLHYCH